MDLPAAFRRQILATFKEDGAAWLSRLPDLIAEYAGRWALAVGPAFPSLSYNYVAPATCADGSPAVLKLGVPRDDLSSEIDALRDFGPDLCVGLLAADPAGGALLIERAEPGQMLASLMDEDDDRATMIAADTMRRLWRQPPAGRAYPSVADWFKGFARLRETYRGDSGPIPPTLLARAEGLCADLLASAGPPLLLHGDLHQYNIVSARRSPWLVIDPKGIVGDPAFEPAALLLNPWDSLLKRPNPGQILRRRLDLLSAELNIVRERLQSWAITFAVLSAWWSLEDNDGGDRHALACANLLVQC